MVMRSYTVRNAYSESPAREVVMNAEEDSVRAHSSPYIGDGSVHTESASALSV